MIGIIINKKKCYKLNKWSIYEKNFNTTAPHMLTHEGNKSHTARLRINTVGERNSQISTTSAL